MRARDHLLQQLLTDLRRQIADSFAPGETLPPRRELASMHGVSPSTIQNALRLLAAEGHVQVRPRAGCSRSPTPQAASDRGKTRRRLTVGIMSPRARDEWSGYGLFPALLAEAAKRGMDVLEIPHRYSGHRRSTPGRWRIELARIPWNRFDVGLVVGAEDTINHAARALTGRKIVVVDVDASEQGLHSVAYADAHAGTLAARHLLSLGHMYFAVTEDANAPGFAWDDAWTKRRHGFEAAVGQAGGIVGPRWRMAIPRQGGAARAQRFLTHELPEVVKAWVREPRERRPTALFTHSLNIIAPLIKELAQHDMRIPRDLSIMTVTCDMRRLRLESGPEAAGLSLTSVDVDSSVLARRAYDAVEEIVRTGTAVTRGGDPAHLAKLYLAPGSLLAGQSTTAPPR